MVSEAGASVYSASKLAAEEFPDFDVTLRSAVSIARRLQDPLAELVKIDPKAIGVGSTSTTCLPNGWTKPSAAWSRTASIRSAWTSTPPLPALLSHVSGVSARPSPKTSSPTGKKTALFLPALSSKGAQAGAQGL